MRTIALALPPSRPPTQRPEPSGLAHEPGELRGICYPADADVSLARLVARTILCRRERCVLGLEGAIRSLSVRPHASLELFLEHLQRLPALGVHRVFDEPWAACLFAPKVERPIDDIRFEVGGANRLRWLFAATVLHGAGCGLGFVVSPPIDGGVGEFYLPELHLLVRAGPGPVAAFLEEERFRLTTGDGQGFTFRRHPEATPRGVHAAGAVLALDRVEGFLVLNGVQPVSSLAVSPTLGGEEVRSSLPVIEQGLALTRGRPGPRCRCSRNTIYGAY